MTGIGLKRRARRALERQLDYQIHKSQGIAGDEHPLMASMAERSAAVRRKLAAVQPIPKAARVLEVGSGAHGLIFFFDAPTKVGVDPLADHYRKLFSAWQGRARTIAAFGEQLPFEDDEFDIVLSDNVVDHAENPRRIAEEMVRVLKPGGLLYFAVNIHHSLYHWAASAHAAWRAVGVPFEITPFADHTVHLTLDSAQRLFAGLPVKIVRQSNDIAEARQQGRLVRARHPGDLLKRWFFKNAQWEMIAVKVVARPTPPS